MRALVFSDIHGKRDSSLFILERIKSFKPDLVMLLGDLLYHGPRNDVPSGYDPKGVIKDLSSIDIPLIAVRGNCEAEVDQMVLPFPVLSETALVFDHPYTILLSHGHKEVPMKGYTHYFSGHTHIALLEKKDGIVHLNPGSLSLPKDGTGGSYATWENGNIKLVKLDGSVIAESGV